MIASAASSPVVRGRSRPAPPAARRRCDRAGSGSMITPVENGSTCSRRDAELARQRRTRAPRARSPSSPVPALALPVLTTRARMPRRPRAGARGTACTGAAQKRFGVNTPATAAPASRRHSTGRGGWPCARRPSRRQCSTRPRMQRGGSGGSGGRPLDVYPAEAIGTDAQRYGCSGGILGIASRIGRQRARSLQSPDSRVLGHAPGLVRWNRRYLKVRFARCPAPPAPCHEPRRHNRSPPNQPRSFPP